MMIKGTYTLGYVALKNNENYSIWDIPLKLERICKMAATRSDVEIHWHSDIIWDAK